MLLPFEKKSLPLPPAVAAGELPPARSSGLQQEATHKPWCWAPWAFAYNHSNWRCYLVYSSLHLCLGLLGPFGQTTLLAVPKLDS